MTVSRVVRGGHAVGGATREKVLKAIEELNYRPDPVLSALAAYRTAGAGKGDGSTVVFLDRDGSQYSREVLVGARREALSVGYSIERHPLPVSLKERKSFSRVLFHRGVRGVLLGPSDHETNLEEWPWENFAGVSIGAVEHRPVLHAVAPDYFWGSFSAVKILLDRGSSRIGFVVNSELEGRTGHRWLGGYLAGIGDQSPLIFKGKAGSRRSFSYWCRRNELDGIITIHDSLFCGWPGDASRFLLLNDFAVGDNELLDQVPRLSSDCARLGADGMRMLHQHLLRREYGVPELPRRSLLQGRWSALSA